MTQASIIETSFWSGYDGGQPPQPPNIGTAPGPTKTLSARGLLPTGTLFLARRGLPSTREPLSDVRT